VSSYEAGTRDSRSLPPLESNETRRWPVLITYLVFLNWLIDYAQLSYYNISLLSICFWLNKILNLNSNIFICFLQWIWIDIKFRRIKLYLLWLAFGWEAKLVNVINCVFILSVSILSYYVLVYWGEGVVFQCRYTLLSAEKIFNWFLHSIIIKVKIQNFNCQLAWNMAWLIRLGKITQKDVESKTLWYLLFRARRVI